MDLESTATRALRRLLFKLSNRAIKFRPRQPNTEIRETGSCQHGQPPESYRSQRDGSRLKTAGFGMRLMTLNSVFAQKGQRSC
jgi:hypothetical protein